MKNYAVFSHHGHAQLGWLSWRNQSKNRSLSLASTKVKGEPPSWLRACRPGQPCWKLEPRLLDKTENLPRGCWGVDSGSHTGNRSRGFLIKQGPTAWPRYAAPESTAEGTSQHTVGMPLHQCLPLHNSQHRVSLGFHPWISDPAGGRQKRMSSHFRPVSLRVREALLLHISLVPHRWGRAHFWLTLGKRIGNKINPSLSSGIGSSF